MGVSGSSDHGPGDRGGGECRTVALSDTSNKTSRYWHLYLDVEEMATKVAPQAALGKAAGLAKCNKKNGLVIFYVEVFAEKA